MDFEPTLSPRFVAYVRDYLMDRGVEPAPSVGEGIRCLNRYDKYGDTGIETSFDFGQSHAEFGARILVAGDVKVDQINEYLMVFLVQALGMATRKQVPFKEVWFCHHSDQNIDVLQQFFSAPVKFSREYNKLFIERSF